MSHTIQANRNASLAKQQEKTVNKSFSFESLESNRYGILVVLFLVVGCLAGIAVGVGALRQVFSLIILAFSTMAALSMMLAVAPMKAIVYTSAIAILADLIIIAINLIV